MRPKANRPFWLQYNDLLYSPQRYGTRVLVRTMLEATYPAKWNVIIDDSTGVARKRVFDEIVLREWFLEKTWTRRNNRQYAN